MWDLKQDLIRMTNESLKNNKAWAELEKKRDQYDEDFEKEIAEEADGEHDSYLIDRDNANEINNYNVWG